MLMPLAFVIGVSMIKDIFEDFKRHKSDQMENFKMAWVYNKHSKQYVKKHWQDIRVGEIVKVECDQFFPADIVLTQSSDSKGMCYVETKNLDGETNLKHKIAEKILNNRLSRADSNIEDVLNGILICENPNDQIYKFEATFF